MNIAFFLIAKKDTVYLPFHSTMRQALEKMEFHHYTAIPLVDEDGKYAGTLTEGDLLWKSEHAHSYQRRNGKPAFLSHYAKLYSCNR